MLRMHCSSGARALGLAMLVLAGPHAWAADECDVPAQAWQPRSALRALAERNGWRLDRVKVDDGCYEIKGRDAEGRGFKAKLDPATLRVITLKRDDGNRGRQRRAIPVSAAYPAGPPVCGSPESALRLKLG